MNDKNWNPGTFLPDTISGNDILGPVLSETRPEALPPPPSNEAPAVSDIKEKKNAAKKKCLYNFQDAFMEANEVAMANTVAMATSSATSSVSCTATTVQSSSSQFKVSSRRPPSIVTLTVKGTAARMGSMTRSRMMGMRVQMRTAAPSTAPAPQLPPTRRRASTVTAATVSSLDMAGLQLHQQVEIMQK